MVPLVLIPNGENTIGPPLTLETPAINVVGVNTTEPDVSSVTLMVTRLPETAKVTLIAVLRFMAAIRASMSWLCNSVTAWRSCC